MSCFSSDYSAVNELHLRGRMVVHILPSEGDSLTVVVPPDEKHEELDSIRICQQGTKLTLTNSLSEVQGISCSIGGGLGMLVDQELNGLVRRQMEQKPVVYIHGGEFQNIYIHSEAELNYLDAVLPFLDISVRKGGVVNVGGMVSRFYGMVSNGGNIDAKGLMADCVDVCVNGPGEIRASANYQLFAHVADQGEIELGAGIERMLLTGRTERIFISK